jgi:galactoside O-acetyltransferase
MVANKDWSKVATAPIRICDSAWLGFDVVVLKGVTIGEGAIVGARSVVTKDVPPWTIAAGNPARVVKEIPLGLRKQ